LSKLGVSLGGATATDSLYSGSSVLYVSPAKAGAQVRFENAPIKSG